MTAAPSAPSGRDRLPHIVRVPAENYGDFTFERSTPRLPLQLSIAAAGGFAVDRLSRCVSGTPSRQR